ncbi:MAG TPA: nitroreductase family protein [Polaromonas sp.]|uniref:nitroreductase family protein n=1 Tax=Polaromonas sp. TaxID=1869339 RepID=UPI002D744C1B|nr:nitroreductase family protein [Polaromonas sp.]HYW56127.1 nitroreductase family protein [Polaromonas sp.]
MTIHPSIALIEQRVSANAFDASHTIDVADIEALVRLATRAPTAYNLQNWRFLALRSSEAKAKLRQLAYGQAKVSEAAVTFIICGTLPDAESVVARLTPFITSGYMSPQMASSWQEGALAQYAHPQTARDEAVRSASLGAATLIHAAQALGLVSGPMVGFDADGVTREFGLGPREIPVMLLAVGRAAPGNWPQKPRRPLAEVLEVS